MATPTSAPLVIAERTDIHKSCKSLESLLNILNEYCEAVSAVASLQKRLAKVLKEAAGLKVIGENSANAFVASAGIFEALAEIDAKYTKVADKEYDGISVEVKKWFKKLVKEEKAHDERIENANAKIKQAGQSYEKKAKKKGVDVSEEHARYINLISTIGPEISQEKYNHALNVTQKHTATTNSVAACLARIADAEWLRVCEGVRRFAPHVGHLGQWRTLCEAGWSQPLPEGLPGLPEPDNVRAEGTHNPNSEQHSVAQRKRVTLDIPESDDRGPSRTPPRYSPVPVSDIEHSPVGQGRQPLPSPARSSQPEQRQAVPSAEPSPLPEQHQPLPSPDHSLQLDHAAPPMHSRPPPPPSAFDTLKQPFFDPVTGSVRTLSAFPAPPTHFPIPPPRQPTQTPQTQPSHSAQSSLTTPLLTESPMSSRQVLWANSEDSTSDMSSKTSQPHFPSPEAHDRSPVARAEGDKSVAMEVDRPVPIRAQSALSERPGDVSIPGQWDEYVEIDRIEREFGVERSSDHTDKFRSYDALQNKPVEKVDTGASNGSLVAAMRNRYAGNISGTTSPTPREHPRVPLSVASLSSKYEENGTTRPLISPRTRAASPPVSRQQSHPLDALRSPLDVLRSSPEASRFSHRPGQTSISGYNDQAQQDIRDRQRELLERERDIETKAKELEQERARLVHMREAVSSSNQPGMMDTVAEEPRGDNSRPSISPLRPRRVSLRKQLGRPLSQVEVDETGSTLNRPRSSYPHQSAPMLAQSRNSDTDVKSRNSADYKERRYEQDGHYSPHAPYCGCDSCSISKYRTPSSDAGNMLRPPVNSDKPKSGWMRRLSMPGGLSSAFSSDSKKGTGSYALGTGVSSSSLASKGLLSLDGKKNSSNTSLLKAQEDGRLKGGRRISYEANYNRSTTNLDSGNRR